MMIPKTIKITVEIKNSTEETRDLLVQAIREEIDERAKIVIYEIGASKVCENCRYSGMHDRVVDRCFRHGMDVHHRDTCCKFEFRPYIYEVEENEH